jgi:hypothetical protein
LSYKAWFVLIACALSVGCHQKSVDFRQVYLGANGPKTPQINYVEDRLSLDKSWIKSTLNEAEFSALRSQIDFDGELLVAIALGERKSASGSIKIRSVYLYTGVASFPLNINARAGVLGVECKNRDRVSSPFTLIILKKPMKFELPGGYHISNFDEGCPPDHAADHFH